MKEKKEIMIVTLQGSNFGNRLQNYALQQYFQNRGYVVITPYYNIPEKNTPLRRIKYFIKVFLGYIKIKKFRKYVLKEKREYRFNQFNRKYISNRFKMSFKHAFKKDWSNILFAVTGSDQVWHKWSDDSKELEYFYLEFLPKEKRISFAPSFGFESFPAEDIEIHRHGILNMKKLSCREESGCELIKEFTNRSAKLICDPTMLLTREEWTKISRKPDYIREENYVLVYFLGKQNTIIQHVIKKYAEDNNLKIVALLDENMYEYYLTTPDEFIWLIENAEGILTDSFHASVFSIIYSKPFKVFRREGKGYEQMFNRIETLLRTYDAENAIYNEGDFGLHLCTIINNDIQAGLISNAYEYLKDVLI